jgi:hypothetical protein
MNSVAEAVKEITDKEDSCKDEVKKHEKRLHGKDGEVGKHVDKMHKEESELDEAEKVPTATGMRVYGSSYGNSAKARRDQTKSDIDTLKGPKTKDLMQKDKEDHMKTKGRYDEAAKPDFLDLDGDKNEKESMEKAASDKKIKHETGTDNPIDFPVIGKKKKNMMKKAASDKKMKEDTEFKDKLIEALKGKQHKIDKNKNNKIDAHDFAILRGQQKEEVEELDEKQMTDAEMAKREKIVKSMKKGFAGFRQRYGKDAKSVMYATATKQAMKEDTFEEEIDPNIRTKDTLKGQEPTSQKDDVGPGSDAKSTKVKFRGGPMKEEVKKSDIPSFLRKARGDKPLTVADAKAGSKDSISSKENLAKARGVSEGKGPESDTVPFVTNAEQPPFDGPYKKIGSTVTDKSGAKHTPMSRARDLARSAMKRIKTEMLGKAPGNNG